MMDRREFFKVGLLTIAGVSGAIKLPGPIESPSIISDELQRCLDGCYQNMLDWGLPDDVPVALIVAPEVKEVWLSGMNTMKVLGRAVTIETDLTIFVTDGRASEVWLQPKWD